MFGLLVTHRLLPLSGMMWAVLASAHPHAWIDVQSTVIMSSSGLATAIEEEWLFDEMYTSFVVNEDPKDRAATQRSAGRFAGKAVENLKTYSYFTKIRSDGRLLPIGDVTQYHSEMRGDRLLFKFTAPLSQPIDPLRHKFEYSVYDPTYYIDMASDPKAPPLIQGSLADHCRLDVLKAKPTAKAIARAFAMDKGAAPDDTLGEVFAEKVEMVCK